MIENGLKVFILEDDEWYNKLLLHCASLNPDFIVKSFFNAKDLLSKLDERPDVVTVDYKLPDLTGEEVLKRIKMQLPETEVIIISEQEDISTAVNLLKIGAYDYLVKEKNIKEKLLAALNNVRKSVELKTKVVKLEKEVQKKYITNNSLIGVSEPMQRVNDLIQKAAKVNITVSITGETGTGKELVAKAIHYSSEKRDKPFVAVNVAAIPADLIESELFGHEKGSFTGATNRRIGKFEEAADGTLFLDEIAEMEITLQSKILRALQEREVCRIGSNTPIKLNCRIIVATHRDLLQEIKSGKFREDLYYRLMGFPIELPPLRERGKDVLIIAKSFIDTFCKDNKLPMKELSAAAQKKLLSYSFPGNVRELKSIVELAAVMANGNTIEEQNITIVSRDISEIDMKNEMTLKQYEMKIIKAYISKYDDNYKLVAQKLDIGLSTLYRLLKEEKENEN